MLEELLEKIRAYNPNVDEDLITKAFNMAEEHHRGQIGRASCRERV